MQNKTLQMKVIDPEIEIICASFENDPGSILEILQVVHEKRGELRSEDIGELAHVIKIPAERAFGVASFYSLFQNHLDTVLVCDGPACWLKGASEVHNALETISAEQIKKGNGRLAVDRTSCLGLCDLAPAALVGENQIGPLDLESVSRQLEGSKTNIPTYKKPLTGEKRVLLKHIEDINPDSIDSAISFGAYNALAKALIKSPLWVIEEVESSGLKGRGGAGFPAGRKWRFVADARGDRRFVICNADESEPLTFKDRVLIDNHPHKIIEGMLLAGYAVGAQEGFIYIRGEYSSQASRLKKAIEQAKQIGWLGDNIQGSEFSFNIHLHLGAGAYICGEETALIESLEGKRGEPRIRPPYPAAYGYKGYPTIVNNVETLAYIPSIIDQGANWFRSIGNAEIPGTKLYTLLGHVNRPGLFEAPYGLTLRYIIDEFGQGMTPGSDFHFAITGGAAGTLVSNEFLDIPITYSSGNEGISLGSGAILICDETISPLHMLREIMHFFEVESCGKCTPCREGTLLVRQYLDHMVSGKRSNADSEFLLGYANFLKQASFCGLGQFAAMPILSTVNNFRQFFV